MWWGRGRGYSREGLTDLVVVDVDVSVAADDGDALAGEARQDGHGDGRVGPQRQRQRLLRAERFALHETLGLAALGRLQRRRRRRRLGRGGRLVETAEESLRGCSSVSFLTT